MRKEEQIPSYEWVRLLAEVKKVHAERLLEKVKQLKNQKEMELCNE